MTWDNDAFNDLVSGVKNLVKWFGHYTKKSRLQL